MVGRLFVLYLCPGDDLARAVVASRRVGGAVARNRAKRLLREALGVRILRTNGSATDIRQRFALAGDPRAGLWVVAVARTAILNAKAQDVLAELDRMLQHLPRQSPQAGGGTQI